MQARFAGDAQSVSEVNRPAHALGFNVRQTSTQFVVLAQIGDQRKRGGLHGAATGQTKLGLEFVPLGGAVTVNTQFGHGCQFGVEHVDGEFDP